jgi:uncharacterized protein (TIGR03663 family)
LEEQSNLAKMDAEAPAVNRPVPAPHEARARVWDRGALFNWIKTSEGILWASIALMAILTRFWGLGWRVMSHDESLHVFYSWWLAKGSGYSHNPMMHGPFLFEATAFFNVIFGANDFVSRLVPALLGIGIVVAVPLLLRPWLGRTGALLAGLFLLISPYVLYYSRYIRHDIQVIAWSLLAGIAILAYMRQRSDLFLLVLAAALALMLSTMEIAFIYLSIFAAFLAARIVYRFGLRWAAVRESAEWDLLVVLATLGAFFSSPIALLVMNPIWERASGQPFVDLNLLSSYSIEWSNTAAGPRLWGLMVFFWAAAAAVGVWWGRLRWLQLAAIFLAITIPLYTTFFTNWSGVGTGFVGSLGYWLSQHEVQRGSQPWYYYLLVFPIYEYLAILVGLAAAAFFFIRRNTLSTEARTFVPLVAWWGVAMWVGLSIAGEKMPWLSTHITMPFLLLAAWGAGHLFVGASGFAHREAARVRPASLAGLAALFLLTLMTLRTSYIVNYINYDYTTEFIGYAHSAPGVKWALDDIEAVAAQQGLGTAMKVAYDSDVSWPMSWYLRDYSGFFGSNPNRGSLEGAPVVLAGPRQWQKVEAYLGGEYRRYEVIRMWWPMEDYKNLSGDRIRGALGDPQMRLALWDIFWSRDYSRYAELTGKPLSPPEQWALEDRMRVYIRQDVAEQVPDLRLAEYRIEDLPRRADTFAGQLVEAAPVQIIDKVGLNVARNLVYGADGSIFVVDSGNSRIVHLNADGSILSTFGERTAENQFPADPGTFSEPWGAAVDDQGFLYVADTWNHRIQKFDSQGNFVQEFGMGGLRSDGPDLFWGPRAIAVAGDRLYITDTGNRRVAVFSTQGQHLFDFSTEGPAGLDEPVGVAVDGEGRVFVADTWNMRVAVFDLEGQFLQGWPVQGWDSASLDNKPYLVVTGGRVYLTDPEGFRVLVYSTEGEPLAAFGKIGDEPGGFMMPNGIAVDPQGRLAIIDAGNNRISIFEPLE